MLGDLVTRLLFAIIVASSLKKGTPLECYICTSLKNSACASSLSDIAMATCSLDGDSISSTTGYETPSTTSASTESTIYSDTEFASTTTDPSTFAASTTEVSFPTTIKTEDSSSAELEITSPSITTTETEDTGEAVAALKKNEITTLPSSPTNESTSSASVRSKIVLSLDNATELLESVITEPQARVLREAHESFACYTLTVTIDGETVTDRGCVVESSSTCDSLQEEHYPSHNLTTCTTCTEDGCNSSAINLSGTLSAFLSLITLLLTR